MLCKTKQQLLESIQKVIDAEARIRTQEQKIQSRMKRVSVNFDTLLAQLYVSLMRSLFLADREFAIHRSEITQKCLITIAFAFSRFFDDHLNKLTGDGNEKWNYYLTDLEFSNDDFCLHSSSFCGSRLSIDRFLKQLREDAEEDMKIRMRVREATELEKEISEQTEPEEITLTLDEAALILQKFERMYQAVFRRSYLREVYQKAMDIRNGMELKMTEEEAVIKIQARTRGVFARKKVQQIRRNEMELLGLSMEAMLKEEIKARNRSIQVNNTLQHSVVSLKQMSLAELLEELKSNFFVSTDPGIPDEEITKRNVSIKNAYQDLYLKDCICTSEEVSLKVNELVSYSTKVCIESRSFVFDIKSFLYGTFIMPKALRTWDFPRKKRWLLLVGAEQSGKTSWSSAICCETGAVHIRLNKNNMARGKASLLKNIMKLVRSSEPVIVSIEGLEIFKVKTKEFSTNKGFLRELLSRLQKTGATVIAESTTNQLEPEIREIFDLEVEMGIPDNWAKFDIIKDCLSRCLEENKPPKIPTRMLELQRHTEKMNSGETAKHIRSRWKRTK